MQNTEKVKQHIFIIGAKSIGQYGGYETFVDMLSIKTFPQYSTMSLANPMAMARWMSANSMASKN